MILGIFFAGLLAYGLFSRVLDTRSITPQIVLLSLGLGLGLVLRGTGEVGVDAELLYVTGEAALILCLFVDAARIDVGALRGTANLPIRLLVIGLPLTILAGMLAALGLLPGITVLEALLVAALVAPTDAALGSVVVTNPGVPRRVRQALNVESGLNDGIVTPIVLLTVVLMGVDDGASTDTSWVSVAVAQIGLGTLAGIAVGAGGALMLKLAIRRDWILPGADWMAAPAMAVVAWFVASALGGNAFIAAFVAGLAATATFGRVPDAFLTFGEVGGELLGLAVFFMFGVLVPTAGLFDPAVILFAVVALTIVRMGPVALALLGTRLAPATAAFMGWFGPRGLASIVLAMIALGDGGDPPVFAPVVIAAVAATVLLSVFAHGFSAGPGVRWYEHMVRTLPERAPEHAHVASMPTRRRAVVTPPHDPTVAVPASSGPDDVASAP